MKCLSLFLSTILLPSSTSGAEILCNTSLLESLQHKDIRYGECKKINLEYTGTKLRIRSTHSVKNGGFASIDIEEHTTYALLSPNSPHLIAPDIYNDRKTDMAFHTRTHYFMREYKPNTVLCSPLLCITVPTSATFTLRPLSSLPSSSNPCPISRYLPLGFIGESTSPAGLCIHYKKFPNTSYPMLQPSSSAALYYFSLNNEIRAVNQISSSGQYRMQKEFPLSPVFYTSPFSSSSPDESLSNTSFSFHSYDLTPYITPESLGFSLSHNLHPIYANPERLYTITTPTRVYSILKENYGDFLLFPEPEEKKSSTSYEELNKEILKAIKENRSDRKARKKKGIEEDKAIKIGLGEDGEGKQYRLLALTLFKEPNPFFKGRDDVGIVGRFSSIFTSDSPTSVFGYDNITQHGALKRYFALADKVRNDWEEVKEDVDSTKAGRTMFSSRDNVLYNWMTWLRSRGVKEGEGMHEYWKQLFKKNGGRNEDMRDRRNLEKPEKLMVMPPLMEEEEIIEVYDTKEMEEEDLAFLVEGNWWGEAKVKEGLWEKYWHWMLCAMGVVVVIIGILFWRSRKPKQETAPLLH